MSINRFVNKLHHGGSLEELAKCKSGCSTIDNFFSCLDKERKIVLRQILFKVAHN